MLKDMVEAMVTESVGRLKATTFPYPVVGEDGVLVKMKMAGVCGTDLHIFHGRMPVNFPLIQGHENLAVVEAIGDRALDKMIVPEGTLSEGDRVTWFPEVKCGRCWSCLFLAQNNHFYCENPRVGYGLGIPDCTYSPHLFGGFAQYVYLMPGTWIYKIPDGMPDEVALLTDVFNVPRLERAQSPCPGVNEGFNTMDTVVIQGSGPVGISAAVRAKALGAERVIMIGAPQNRLDIALKFGVDQIINMERVTDWKERARAVIDATNGRGADLVVEAAGSATAFREGLEMTRYAGVYYELGCTSDVGTVEVDPYRHFCGKDVHVYGQSGTPPQEYQTAIKLLRTCMEKYPLSELITHKFKLEQLAEGFRSVEQGESMKAAVIL